MGLAALLAGAVLLLAACGASATQAPSPTPTAAPTATPSPTAAPTPTSTPSPAAGPTSTPRPDPAAGLQIAAPYTIERMDPAMEAALAEQMQTSLGAMTAVLTVGGRQVTQGGILRAYVVVLAFPPEMTSIPSFETSIWAGMEASLGQGEELPIEKVDGIDVRVVQSGSISMGVFLVKAQVLMMLPPGPRISSRSRPRSSRPIADARRLGSLTPRGRRG